MPGPLAAANWEVRGAISLWKWPIVDPASGNGRKGDVTGREHSSPPNGREGRGRKVTGRRNPRTRFPDIGPGDTNGQAGGGT